MLLFWIKGKATETSFLVYAVQDFDGIICFLLHGNHRDGRVGWGWYPADQFVPDYENNGGVYD